MSYNEIIALCKWGQAIGLKTVIDLRWFKKIHGCKTNNELLNKVHEVYIKKAVANG